MTLRCVYGRDQHSYRQKVRQPKLCSRRSRSCGIAGRGWRRSSRQEAAQTQDTWQDFSRPPRQRRTVRIVGPTTSSFAAAMQKRSSTPTALSSTTYAPGLYCGAGLQASTLVLGSHMFSGATTGPEAAGDQAAGCPRLRRVTQCLAYAMAWRELKQHGSRHGRNTGLTHPASRFVGNAAVESLASAIQFHSKRHRLATGDMAENCG